ncbi:MAG: response regulator [Acidobacteriota bacterium]
MSATNVPRTILIIDDDPDVVSYLEAVVRDAGHNAVGTTDSGQGLTLARQLHPDVICLDIVMPEPTGVKLYRDLRADAELSLIPIVMVTGVLPQFRDFIHHRKHVPPPDGYLAKPFSPAELIATLERLMPQQPQA